MKLKCACDEYGRIWRPGKHCGVDTERLCLCPSSPCSTVGPARRSAKLWTWRTHSLRWSCWGPVRGRGSEPWTAHSSDSRRPLCHHTHRHTSSGNYIPLPQGVFPLKLFDTPNTTPIESVKSSYTCPDRVFVIFSWEAKAVAWIKCVLRNIRFAYSASPHESATGSN